MYTISTNFQKVGAMALLSEPDSYARAGRDGDEGDREDHEEANVRLREVPLSLEEEHGVNDGPDRHQGAEHHRAPLVLAQRLNRLRRRVERGDADADAYDDQPPADPTSYVGWVPLRGARSYTDGLR